MKTFIKHWILVIFLSAATLCTAQNDSIITFGDPDWKWNSVYMQNEEEEITNTEELLELIEEQALTTRPNINELSYGTAIRHLHLSDFQYYQLQLYIETYGPLVSIYEIVAIDGYSKEDMFRLKEMVTVHSTSTRLSGKTFFKGFRNNLLLRYQQVLEHQLGYDTTQRNHYDGSPAHVCFRYTAQVGEHITLKLSGEKDAGEQFFRGEQRYGFDFYAGSLALQRVGILRTAVLGDYRIGFGQGVVCGNSLLSGKGNIPDEMRRFGNSIRPVAPTNEGEFLRGAAISLGRNRLQGALFGGQRFQSTSNCMGADITFLAANFKIGGRLLLFSETDTALSTFSSRMRSVFRPTLWNGALDYQLNIHRILLFGEIAMSGTSGWGFQQTILFALTPVNKVAVLFRNYSKDFATPLGNAFRNSSKGVSETGVYLTFQHIINRNTELHYYADYHILHETSYQTSAPIEGFDFGVNLQHHFSRHSTLLLNYTFRNRPENDPDGSTYYKELREHHRHRIKLQFAQIYATRLKMKTDIDCILNRYPEYGSRHTGFLIYQDLTYEMQKPAFSFNLRIAYFDTDRYDERLYAYENDVYYAFTIGSYYYKGVRGYLVIRYKIKRFSLWLRLSQTHYLDRNVISSGLSQIDKPHKTEIKIQSVYNF